ncbi:hypothetical protein PIB30_013881 [Stylosanthes scabra]|uniref:Uncharacterized protein n=1 Tax=Stylosanthes scabra TaxID=79078 RepID=A0ABU6V4V8_9FABA|nr:hypothetical protein [Stylosanthes scabra]
MDKVPPEDKDHDIALFLTKDYFLAQAEFSWIRRKAGDFMEKQVCWIHPKPPFVKLMDQYSKMAKQLVCGILKDHDGRFQGCLSANLGNRTVIMAELWDILLALELVLSMNFTY